MADIPPTDALSEFDRFCRFIDGMHMGGFVENDFMCKAIQNKIREALLRADLSPPVPDDVASALDRVRDLLGSLENRITLDDQLDILKICRAASTPSAEVRALREIREIYCNMEGFIPETAPEAYVLQEIKKMYDTAVEALNQPHTGGK